MHGTLWCMALLWCKDTAAGAQGACLYSYAQLFTGTTTVVLMPPYRSGCGQEPSLMTFSRVPSGPFTSSYMRANIWICFFCPDLKASAPWCRGAGIDPIHILRIKSTSQETDPVESHLPDNKTSRKSNTNTPYLLQEMTCYIFEGKYIDVRRNWKTGGWNYVYIYL